MKKKRLLATVLSICTLASTFGMASCDDLAGDIGGGNNNKV